MVEQHWQGTTQAHRDPSRTLAVEADGPFPTKGPGTTRTEEGVRWLGQEGRESSHGWTIHFWLLVGSLPQVGPEPPLASLRPPHAQRLTRAFPPWSLYLPPLALHPTGL